MTSQKYISCLLYSLGTCIHQYKGPNAGESAQASLFMKQDQLWTRLHKYKAQLLPPQDSRTPHSRRQTTPSAEERLDLTIANTICYLISAYFNAEHYGE